MRLNILLATLPVVAMLGMAPLAVSTFSRGAPAEDPPCQPLDPKTGLAVGQRILVAIQPGERLQGAPTLHACAAETPTGP